MVLFLQIVPNAMQRLLRPLLVVGLAGLIVWLAYGVADQAVTLEHQRSEGHWLTEDRMILKKLLLDLSTGRNRAEVMELLQRKYGSSIIKEEGSDVVSVDRIRLVFKDGKLADVLLSEDPIRQ